jgi:O-acetyl-ADP-ribose deacetylase (regulator of RNase III)/uncharacterized protein YwgA
MIKYKVGNIIESESECIVNTVNLYGVMGKGIALAFKNAFPKNFEIYKKACDDKKIDIGRLLLTETGELYPKYIINFPTKKHWRNPSKIEYIEAGMKDLVRIIKENDIKSISIPPLGSGNGRLNWKEVKNIIEDNLEPLSDWVDIVIYDPGYKEENAIENKEIKLTDARTMFLFVLWNYTHFSNELNLLVAQKIAYFLQRFGATLNLKFEKGHYGPYSYNLNHLLKHINGCYLHYNQDRTSPLTKVVLNQDKFEAVKDYYDNSLSDTDKNIIEKVIDFIDGFESTYGMEVLGSVDYVVNEMNLNNLDLIIEEISKWNPRKAEIIDKHHIKVSLDRINEYFHYAQK